MARDVTFWVNDRAVRGPEGGSLLAALRTAGVDVPSLCYHEAVQPYGACRLCLVEVETESHGRVRRRLTTSCNYPVLEGIRVFPDTERVVARRRVVLELLLAEAPRSTVVRELAARYGVRATRFRERDEECILCGLCARVCREVIGVDAIDFGGRGGGRTMGSPYGETAERCIGCGACAYVCPVGCVRVEDRGGMRSLERWNVRREMVRCAECGGVVGTMSQIAALRARFPAEDAVFTRCPDCRRKYYAGRVAVEGHM